MIQTENAPPNERRNFVHKRLIGAAKGFVSSGFNPLSAAGGFLTEGGDREQKVNRGRALKLGGDGGISGRRNKSVVSRTLVPQIFGKCIPPFFDDGQGGCEIDLIPGPGGGGTGANRGIGEAVMGRYGAAEVPGNLVVNRAVCRPGMVVADDGLCYNKSQIRNSQREWPRGRRPLLTGGDMRAISTAARAGKRLEGATKRLQKIGLMKKPAPRRAVGLASERHRLQITDSH